MAGTAEARIACGTHRRSLQRFFCLLRAISSPAARSLRSFVDSRGLEDLANQANQSLRRFGELVEQSNTLRSIARLYRIGEIDIARWRSEGITLSWVDGFRRIGEPTKMTNIGAIAFSHEPTGFVEYIVPMYVHDGNFRGVLDQAVGMLNARVDKKKREQFEHMKFLTPPVTNIKGVWCGAALG